MIFALGYVVLTAAALLMLLGLCRAAAQEIPHGRTEGRPFRPFPGGHPDTDPPKGVCRPVREVSGLLAEAHHGPLTTTTSRGPAASPSRGARQGQKETQST